MNVLQTTLITGLSYSYYILEEIQVELTIEQRLKLVEERIQSHRLAYRNRGTVTERDLEIEQRLLRHYRELQSKDWRLK